MPAGIPCIYTPVHPRPCRPSALTLPCPALSCLSLQGQINQLIAEREAWIEEVTTQRAEASAAIEAARALERRFAEVAEERQQLGAALEEVQLRRLGA